MSAILLVSNMHCLTTSALTSQIKNIYFSMLHHNRQGALK